MNNEYTIIPHIRFILSYDDGVQKTVNVCTDDVVTCTYKGVDNAQYQITGKVTKIGCNFNSSLGAVGTTAYLQIDGSEEYSGSVVLIKPQDIINICINSTSNRVNNIVCSVDNIDQSIVLIRENEVGVFQYSKDGITWLTASLGQQGMSAYECAVKLGYGGTEAEWLASLVGAQGPKGDTGNIAIKQVYDYAYDMAVDADKWEDGDLLALRGSDVSYLYRRHVETTSGICTCNVSTSTGTTSTCPTDITGYDYLGLLSVPTTGAKGDEGPAGKSAYEFAVDGGYTGTEEEFATKLATEPDSQLDAESTNAVQNKVITERITYLENAVANIEFRSYNKLADYTINPVITDCIEDVFKDLAIYGTTDTVEFAGTSVSSIKISNSDGSRYQEITFDEPVVLRSVPTDNASCATITVNGQLTACDFIGAYHGQYGVIRKVAYIDSYTDECIISDYITNAEDNTLNTGAKVMYVTHVVFEPFDSEMQEKFKALHTYEGGTSIVVDESALVSATYYISLESYISSMIEKAIGNLTINEQTIMDYIDNKVKESEGTSISI